MENLCSKCWYNTYDEENDEDFCSLQLDEDEYSKLAFSPKDETCKYFRPDTGEYSIVRKQN